MGAAEALHQFTPRSLAQQRRRGRRGLRSCGLLLQALRTTPIEHGAQMLLRRSAATRSASESTPLANTTNAASSGGSIQAG